MPRLKSMPQFNLTLRQRLFTGCGVLAALTVLACVFGLSTSTRLSGSFDELLDKTIASADAATAASGHTQTAATYQREFLLTRDLAAVEAVGAELASARSAMQQASSVLGDPARTQQAEAVIAVIDSLSSANTSLAQAYEERGLTHEQGLEGNLRKAVHALQTTLNT